MESGGSGAGDDGVVQDAARKRSDGRAGRRQMRWEYLADMRETPGGRRRERVPRRARGTTLTGGVTGGPGGGSSFFLKGPKAFFNCFQYWNTGNAFFELNIQIQV